MLHLRPLRAVLLALAIPAAACAAEAPAPASAPASSPLVTPAGNLMSIELMSSTIMQEGQSSFSGLGIRTRFTSPRLMSQIEVMPTLEWWRNANTIKPYGIETTRKDATLGVDAVWNFSNATFKPYAGAGIAIHFLSNKVVAPSLGLPDASTSVTKGGLALLGGVSFALTGKFENFLDVKYHHVTDYRQLKINWGISYNL